jgi:hypothetical protein
MTKQHKATPEQWESIERWAEDNVYDACFLELRARIEALEAAQQPPLFTAEEVARIVAPVTRDRDETGDYLIVGGTPAPAGSLVERVAIAIVHAPCEMDYEPQARAAILQVAAWLVEQAPEPGPVGKWLGQISTPFAVMADMLRDEANR